MNGHNNIDQLLQKYHELIHQSKNMNGHNNINQHQSFMERYNARIERIKEQRR